MTVCVDKLHVCVWIQWEDRSNWEHPEGETWTCSHCPPSALCEDVRICHISSVRSLLFCNSWQIIWQPFIREENTSRAPLFLFIISPALLFNTLLLCVCVCVCVCVLPKETTLCPVLQSPKDSIILSVVSHLLLFGFLRCRASCTLQICQGVHYPEYDIHANT